MEPYNQRVMVFELLTKFTEPAKFKIRFYQLVVAMCIETLLSLFISKYVIFRLKIEEKKNQINYHFNIQQTILLLTTRIDWLASQVLQKSFMIFNGLKTRLANGFAQIQSMNEECLTHEQTPELFCEPYIYTGFRPINKPYMYYVKSLFKKHNETVNAWSHYLGAIYTLSWAFRLDFADPYSWPILTTIITSTIMFFASASAHLMHQKSHYCHMTCFLCDFAGISFNGFGAALMQTYICSPIWYFRIFEPYLLPAIGVQSALCCLFNCLAQTAFKRPYPPIKRFLQFAPCGILWIFTNLPLFIPLLFPESGDHPVIHVSYGYHLGHICLFLIGAAFFALDFPQRFFPGKLDFIGQGHHLFHVCIFFVVTFQLEGIYKDYVINRELIAASRDPPTMVFCFISLTAVIIYYMYLIRKFSSAITHNFDSEGNYIGAEEECDKYKHLECEHHVVAAATEEPLYHDASDDERAFRREADSIAVHDTFDNKKEN